ncbi:hypothetical protein F2Q68_00001783 [Brassica cretica]|uniref:Reverse transcriptase zinc-binding domain-containing protein n=1 Tax=Brassica cretica TaxID=69181 RepID=A0A8S9JJ05_BRACR|nr:hypothetical protein F2Q68_00001783 [Brassica cretica]
MLTNTLCSRCGAVEMQEHLFFQCSFARQVWELAPWSSQNYFPQTTTFTAALQSSYLQKNLPPYGIVSNVFPWISWHLWTTRNKLIFDSRSTTPHDVVLPPTPPLIIPTATIFCNTDAAWKSDSNSAGLAWIFSDQSGLEIDRSSSAQDHVASPMHG